MEKKEVEVNGKKFQVHELLATEFDDTQRMEDSVDRVVALIKKSASMSDEDYGQLTLKERTKVMDTINELNGWEDFQKSETVESKE